ncbi:single-stranded-DNA-specific exonuclease RecJ [Myroides sp. LJL119]
MRWIFKAEVDQNAVEHLKTVLGVDSVIATLLVERNITTFQQAKSFFRPSLDQLHDPFLMKDMDLAVQRIHKAIQTKESVLVFGDYDVDGTTSVAMMSSYLRKILPSVRTYIPDRYTEGYGISFQGIDYAFKKGITLIIALDCGIKSIEKVEYAKNLGIDFIICDHHLPAEKIPDAIAVLDPKRSDCSYPYKDLCGCGVGFKLIQALEQVYNRDAETLMVYLDLVAMAIVADVVPLTGENRILAFYGLKVINENPRPGIKALLSFYKQKSYTLQDIVFKVAPKINAAGRIEHGKYAVDLLTEFTDIDALERAKNIININEERKHIDQSITEQALVMIAETLEINNKSTVVFNPEWHRGVIGIVASRLIDTYYRPTIVFTQSGEFLTGSARSVKNFDIYQAIEKCEEFIVQFGGHKYAAGLTIHRDNYVSFKQKFEKIVMESIAELDLIPELVIDKKIELNQITPKFIRILKQFEPFGQANEKPIFFSDNLYDIGKGHSMGKNQEHLKLYVKQRGLETVSFAALGFGFGKYAPSLENRRFFNLIYSIEENFFRGKYSVQLAIKDMQLV